MIGGATALCLVVADPVAQLRTPQSLNEIWMKEGRDIVAVPAHVPASDLGAFMSGFRVNRSIAGAVITVPHKRAAVMYCDELGPNASRVRAVNAIRRTAEGRLVGETYDGLGFVAGLAHGGVELDGRKVVVLGAGGAASAVAFALLDAGVSQLDISNRTPSRARDLAQQLRLEFPSVDIGVGTERAPAADMIVNASSAGMGDSGESPLLAHLMGDALLADVVISDGLTPFLQAGADRGNPVHGGAHMLKGQLDLIARHVAAS